MADELRQPVIPTAPSRERPTRPEPLPTPAELARHRRRDEKCGKSEMSATMRHAEAARIVREAVRDKSYMDFPMGVEAGSYLIVKRKRLTVESFRDCESSLDSSPATSQTCSWPTSSRRPAPSASRSTWTPTGAMASPGHTTSTCRSPRTFSAGLSSEATRPSRSSGPANARSTAQRSATTSAARSSRARTPPRPDMPAAPVRLRDPQRDAPGRPVQALRPRAPAAGRLQQGPEGP